MERIQITTKEAAAMLGVGMSTLAAWRLRGYGPPWFEYPSAHGGRTIVRYDRVMVARWKAEMAKGRDGA